MSAEPRKGTIGEQRARLVVRCACDLLGLATLPAMTEIRVDLSAEEFRAELERRYGAAHPELVFRKEASIERARLERGEWPELPRVILRKGVPAQARTVVS